MKTAPQAAAPVSIRLGALQAVFEASCAASDTSPGDAIRELIAQVMQSPQSQSDWATWVRSVQPAHAAGDGARMRLSVGAAKEPFLQWCKEQGLSVSAALRLLLARRLADRITAKGLVNDPGGRYAATAHESLPQTLVHAGQTEATHDKHRLRLRLKPSEMSAITALAEQRGLSAQAMVRKVVRAYLLQAAVFSHREVVDLGAINLALMRIGTNLNQMVRHLNAHPHAQPVQLEIRQCIEQINAHVKDCAQALALSRERWRIEIKD